MIDWKGIANILWGDRVYFPGLYRDKYEYLSDAGLPWERSLLDDQVR